MGNCRKTNEFDCVLKNLPEDVKQSLANFSADEIIFEARNGILDISYEVAGEKYTLFDDLDSAGFIRYDLDFRHADLVTSSGKAALLRWLYNELYGQPERYHVLRGYHGGDEYRKSWLFNHEYENIPRMSDQGISDVLEAIAGRLEWSEMAALYTTCTGRRKSEWAQIELERRRKSALDKLKTSESFRVEIEGVKTLHT